MASKEVDRGEVNEEDASGSIISLYLFSSLSSSLLLLSDAVCAAH